MQLSRSFVKGFDVVNCKIDIVRQWLRLETGDVFSVDVDQRKDEIFGITEKLIRGLIDETRAEIILPLGGALIPYVVDPNDLAKATGVQVLNTKAIGIRFAEMCVAFGMTQSNLTYPRAKLRYDDFVKPA